ncbi:MAG: hypothetical protein J0H17_06445 [Rhizobiales bacterium]|nr:hypothetical protein [Hyphomicrobiales bacterium]
MTAKSHRPSSRSRARPAFVLAALVLAAASGGLSGCGSMMASMPLIGEPKNAPPRPEGPTHFPGAFAPTADPSDQAMTAAERDKLKADLMMTRDTAAAKKREEINQSAPTPPPQSRN